MSRRRKPPPIEELLCDRNLSNTDILPELQQVQDDDSIRVKLLSSEAGRQALAQRLNQGSEECQAIAAAEDAAEQTELLEAHTSALGLLAALMPNKPGDKLARVLLHGSKLLDGFDAVLSCISKLCQECSAWPSTPAVEQLLSAVGQAGRDVLSVVQDIACYEYKATVAGQGTQLGGTQNKLAGGTQNGKTSTVFGREQCGDILMGSILGLATMDTSLSKTFFALRRSAVSSLVAICACSRRCQATMVQSHTEAYNTLMGEMLAGCGDAYTQVDIFELMYRCGKAFSERAYRQHLDAQMRGKFAELLAMDARDIGDLSAALHGLVLDYNNSIPDPSVHHITANKIQILSPLQQALVAQGSEVSLGSGHLALDVLAVDEGGTHNELCDIDYSDVLRVLVTSVNGSDNNTQMQMQVQVDVQCKSFPRSLGTMLEESAREQAGGKSPWFRLGMLLQPAEGDRLLKLLRAHGVTVVSQSNNVLEPSQQDAKPRKVSMGNMPLSYKPKKPLNLTKTTPATDNRVKPLALTFKTPQTAPPAAAAAEAAEEDAAADDDDDLAADSDQQHPSPEFGTTAAGNAAAAAPAADLAAETPAAAADGAAGGRESQMLQALLETAEQMPTTHTRVRPTLSSSLMAGASPEPPAKRAAAAAAEEQSEGAEGTGDEEEGVAVKETAPAAAVGAAGWARKQQKQKGGARGKQQQQGEQEEQQGKARGADSVSWDAAADEEVGPKEGGEVQQEEDNLHSNSQELDLEASPAAAVKARRRSNKAAAAAEPTAVADSKRKGAGKQAAANTVKPEPATRAAAAAKPPAGANKPPAGRGKKAAERKAPANGLQLECRSKRQQAAKETQDPIQDPDLPSLQPPASAARTAPAPAAAAGEGASPDMPSWFNTSAAAGKAAGAAASAPVNKVTTPYSSRNAQKAASSAAAAAAAAEGEDAPAAAAASPNSGGRKKAGRLAKLGATPQGKGKPPAAAAGAGNAGDLYAFPDQAGAEATAADAVGGKGQKGRQAATAKQRKAATAAAAAAEDKAAGKPQQQQQLSDFEFPASDSEGEGDDVNDNDVKAGKGGRGGKAGRGGRGGRGKGRGAAAAKAGSKRKAASAAEGDTAAAGNKQKQQRKGAAAAAAAADDDGGAEQQHELGDVVFGTVDDDIIPASDMLNLNLDSQPDETAAAAAGASPAAGRREPRASRASKSKALEAMQQQQKLLDQPTQAEPQLFEDDREFGDLQPLDLQADFDQHNEEVLGGNDGDEFGGLGAVGPQSPGTHSGSGAKAGDASDSDASGEMGRMQALLQGAAGKRGTEHSRQLARLLQGSKGTAAAAAAAETPDADKIHTAQVRRKLPLTAAATKAAAAANRSKPAAAAAARSPLGVPAAGKRRAGAAAEGALGGFQLPGLGSDEPLSSPSDLGAAGAHDPATGFNLGLTHRRKPGKGFGGLKGLNLSPADAGGGSSDSDEGAAAGAATRFGGLREGAGRKQQQQRRGGFAGVGSEEDAGQLEEGTEEQMAAVVDTLAKTFRGVDDDSDTDSDDDEIPLESQMKQMLMAIFKHRQQTDQKKTEKDIQDLQARLQEQMAEYQAELKKEFNALAIKGDAQADKYLSQLEKKAAELQALQERQRLELEQQWEEYKAVYVKAAGMYQALSAARERGVSVHKRKLAELQQNVLGQIAEKEAQLTAKKARVGSNFKQTIMLLQAAAAQ